MSKQPDMVIIPGRGIVAEAVVERYRRMHPHRPIIALVLLDGEGRREPVEPEPPPDLPEVWEAPPEPREKPCPNPFHRRRHPRR